VPTAAAIVVAAGPGSRLGAPVPKAFVELGGVPLVVRSLRAMLAVPAIGSAVVVVPVDCGDRACATLDTYGPWRCAVHVVIGGAERQASVRHGLAAVAEADLIVIHDAARPFVSVAAVEAAIAAAAVHGAAVVSTPATDTIKQVAADGRIEHTPPRQSLWLAQTPQVFRSALIRAAHDQAAAAVSDATDDAMLVERLGAPVYVVPGNAENRKITTAEDLRWAEWLLAQPPTRR
jgi:2-C-methyl-D-erythritol 4-phosphate cytidylyltransferase